MDRNLENAEQMAELSPHLGGLCKPLFAQTPITLYSYSELHSNGNLYMLSTNKSLVEGLFTSACLQDELSGYGKHLRYEGFFLTDLHSEFRTDSAPLFARLQKIGKGHECLYVDRSVRDRLQIHSFYGDIENDLLNLFFLNNTKMLRYFCRYAEKDLALRLKVMKPYLPPPEIRKKAKGIIRSIKPIETPTPKFLLSLAKYETISRRQREVIYWYLKGKTSEETATILGIKYATVETHFLRIKQKLGCNSKQQILSEIFCHSDFWSEFSA